MRELTADELSTYGLQNDSTPLDTAIAAEKLPPHLQNYVKSIYSQESGGGKNTRTSNAGAVGGMQIMPETFKSVADRDWDINNPVHNARAGVRYAVKMYEQAGGNPQVAAAGYYGGPGGLQKAKHNVPVGDPRNPNAPTTLQYGQQVASRLPKLRELTPEETAMLNQSPAGSPEKLAGMEHTDSSSSLPKFGGTVGGLNMLDEVKQMPYSQRAMIAAGHELSKLGAGAKDFGYFLQDVVGSPDAVNKTLALQKEQAAEDKLYEPFDSSAGFAATAGSSLPYFVSGAIGGPTAARVGEAVIDKAITGPLSAAGRASRSMLRTATDAAKGSSIKPVSAFGRKLETDITNPTAREAMRKMLQPSLPDPYYAGNLKDILGGSVLGATEGALHYDNSALGGAATGALGTLGGVGLKRLTNRLPDYRTKPERELLDWYKDQGGMPSHGLDSGSKRLQNFENQLAKSEDWSDAAALYNQENQLVNNQVAYKAMGIDAPVGTHLSPAELAEHQKSLQDSYKALELGTRAKFTADEIKSLRDHVGDLGKNSPLTQKKYVRAADKYVSQIEDSAKIYRDSLTGKIVSNKTLNGEAFQTIRSNLQADINKAYKDGDANSAKVLQPILNKLDQAIERGVAEARGDATLNQWKDLNRKYAMTNIVYEHGLNPSGVDANKLYQYFAGTDAKRLFLEQGPKQLNDLQKLAKIEYLSKHQDRTLSGIKNSGNPGPVEKLLGIPGAMKLPVIPRVALSMYKAGYPVRTGLLNMGPGHQFNVGGVRFDLPQLWESPSMYTRALAQGAQPYSTAAEKAKEYYDKFNSLWGN